MRDEIDIENLFGEGEDRGQTVGWQAMESVYKSVGIVLAQIDTDKRLLVRSIRSLRVEFKGNGFCLDAYAHMVVFDPPPREKSFERCEEKRATAKAEFRLGSSCPTKEFVQNILDAISQELGIRSAKSRPERCPSDKKKPRQYDSPGFSLSPFAI